MACNNDCSSCKEKCDDRKVDLIIKNDFSKINKIIGVMSGKGGVGKSLVTSLLASKMAKLGYKVGILDADITGPSIPHAFGITGKLEGTNKSLYPAISKSGIKIVSVNLLVENPTDAVVWRGPILANAVKQFYSETVWEEIDYLFVDMPPGTSDVALTVYQQLPINGVVLVTSPQDLVSMIVGKAVSMAQKTNVKIIGLVENMSYMNCPCCDEVIYPFGKSRLEDVCTKYNLIPLAKLPIDPNIASSVDEGKVEDLETNNLDIAVNEIINL